MVATSVLRYARSIIPTTLLVCRAAFATRLFSVLRFESVIHEFDPYFNFRTTKFLSEEGPYAFHNWCVRARSSASAFRLHECG